MSVELTKAERDSLREIAHKDLMKKRIPQEHADKLIRLGLIEQKLGGLVATSKGRLEVQKSI